MSSLYVSFSTNGRSKEQSEAELKSLVSGAFRAPETVAQTALDQSTSVLVVRHQRNQSSGVSAAGRRYRIIVAGSVWRDDSARGLLTPADVLELIEREGIEAAKALPGHYVLVAIDADSRQVQVVRSMFSHVPCYYSSTASRLVVASELRAFRSLRQLSIDHQGLAQQARFGHVLTDSTIFRDVRRLPEGAVLNYTCDASTVTMPTLPEFSRDKQLDDSMLDALDESFDRSLARFRSTDSRILASLSGGLDSRIIVAALVRKGFDVTCFSTGIEGSQEVAVARTFAATVGVSHVVHYFDGKRFPRWFPTAVRVAESRCHPVHMHFMDAMICGSVPSLPHFHGLVGDVVIGGDLDLSRPLTSPGELRSLCLSRIQEVNQWWRSGSAAKVWGSDLAIEMNESEVAVLDFAMAQSTALSTYSAYLWSRYIFRLFGTINPSLASQVQPWSPMITPYLDPGFFKISASLRLEEIADRRAQISWALRAFPEVASIPRVKDGALVPVAGVNLYEQRVRRVRRLHSFRNMLTRATLGVVNLPAREGYPEYGQWYRKWKGVREYVDDTLLSRRSLERGLWSQKGIRAALHDLRVGRDTWPAVAGVLQLEVLLQQLSE